MLWPLSLWSWVGPGLIWVGCGPTTAMLFDSCLGYGHCFTSFIWLGTHTHTHTKPLKMGIKIKISISDYYLSPYFWKIGEESGITKHRDATDKDTNQFTMLFITVDWSWKQTWANNFLTDTPDRETSKKDCEVYRDMLIIALL